MVRYLYTVNTRNFGRFTVYGSVPRLTVNNSPDFPDSNSAIIRLLGTIFMPKYTLEEKQKHLEDEFEIPMSNEMEEAMKEMSSFCDFYVEYGEARGEARGEIKGVIRFCHDKMHYSVDAIIEAIREQFGITKEEAQKYVDETLKLEKV